MHKHIHHRLTYNELTFYGVRRYSLLSCCGLLHHHHHQGRARYSMTAESVLVRMCIVSYFSSGVISCHLYSSLCGGIVIISRPPRIFIGQIRVTFQMVYRGLLYTNKRIYHHPPFRLALSFLSIHITSATAAPQASNVVVYMCVCVCMFVGRYVWGMYMYEYEWVWVVVDVGRGVCMFE